MPDQAPHRAKGSARVLHWQARPPAAPPPMNALLRAAIVLPLAAAALVLQASCARSVGADTSDPVFVSPAQNPVPLTACVNTECPLPWASCPNGGLCTTDTSRDIEHCGACGASCPPPPSAHHATALCSNGKCAIACDELSADCNHKSFDGCEVFTGDDPLNCGGCGLACKTGELCWKGACGCPGGFTQCGNDCRDLESDNNSCGTCDKKCVPPPSDDPEWKCGPNIQPANTTWACGNAACQLSCKPLYGDCNNNLCSDGCEIDERPRVRVLRARQPILCT